ncbi:MAG TPA: molybdenum cofactor biosynthesis protein MoaE [Opitutaceae bacterium]
MPFTLTDTAIDPSALQAEFNDVRAGAFVTFEGRVRDVNEGKSVLMLGYEAFAPLARREGERILAEAAAEFGILWATCVHRTGELKPGDLAVWVAVAAGHRGAAFDACRYIIDETKARVPIWKREHYSDGTTEWINCATRGPASPGH